jgi:hypothetical protein
MQLSAILKYRFSLCPIAAPRLASDSHRSESAARLLVCFQRPADADPWVIACAMATRIASELENVHDVVWLHRNGWMGECHSGMIAGPVVTGRG